MLGQHVFSLVISISSPAVWRLGKGLDESTTSSASRASPEICSLPAEAQDETLSVAYRAGGAGEPQQPNELCVCSF